MALQMDYERIVSQHGRIFLWTTWRFYTPIQVMLVRLERLWLESIAGPFDEQGKEVTKARHRQFHH
jgi:hypothetical protein